MKKILVFLMAGVVLLTSCNLSVEQDNKNNETQVSQGEVAYENDHKIEDEPMHGKEIIVGYGGGICDGTPAYAMAEGIFEDAGLNVKVSNVQSPIESLGSNNIQMYIPHIAASLVPASNGMNIKFVAGTHSGCKSLYVLEDSEIESTQDLVGKSVAIPSGIGDSDHNIAMRFFGNDGIRPEEINYRVVETSAVMQALENNEIQASVLGDLFAYDFVKKGILKPIRSLTYDDDFKIEPCCIFAFNGDFIEENPLIAEKMVTILKDVGEEVQNNPEHYVDVLFENNWATGDYQKALEEVLSYDWTMTDQQTEEALIRITNDYKDFGIMDKDIDTQKFIDQVWQPLARDSKKSAGVK